VDGGGGVARLPSFGGSIVFTLYAMHAISLNLFGSDRAGLTLQLLAPITDRELAWGKVVGFAGIVAAGLGVCLVASVAVAHAGPLPYWIAVFLGALAALCLISPMAIWFSAIFPVASDLSKTGAAGNPHPFPMVVGTLCTALFVVPTIVALALCRFWFKSAAMAPLFAGLWMLVAAASGFRSSMWRRDRSRPDVRTWLWWLKESERSREPASFGRSYLLTFAVCCSCP
jgi:hypothetical protein